MRPASGFMGPDFRFYFLSKRMDCRGRFFQLPHKIQVVDKTIDDKGRRICELCMLSDEEKEELKELQKEIRV